MRFTSAEAKARGLDAFDGKAGDYRFWRQRMTNYIANEESSYGELIEWARSQKETITENIEVKQRRGRQVRT